MTKDIILTISGLHATDGEADAPVEIMTPGQYFLKSGKHYVVYDEVIEGLEGTVKSTIKFTESKVELMRTGAASTRMVFEEEKEGQGRGRRSGQGQEISSFFSTRRSSERSFDARNAKNARKSLYRRFSSVFYSSLSLY